MFNKKKLENGLRVITVPTDNTKAVTTLVLVGTGSKYENEKNNGISHFIEHMFFKGTEKRPDTLSLAGDLDKVGGSYNAFTSKELTGYWAKVHSNHLDLSLDWVSDIFLNSKLEEDDIEREKGVIIEELNMYLDTPIKHIQEIWEKSLYGDQPAGWLTIGEKENISGFEREDLLEYLNNHYLSENTLVCVAGKIDSQIRKSIKNYFSSIETGQPKPKQKVEENQKEPNFSPNFKETDQTHLALGVRGFNLFQPKRYAQSILATILGGNMSSRLFIEIREKRGLAYYINTSSDANTDTGYLVTLAGIEHKSVEKAVELILKEYRKLKRGEIEKKELKKAKDYLKGNMTLSLESTDAKASFYSIQEMLTGEVLTPEEKFRKIDAVTLDEVKEVAEEMFQSENLNLALIGPHKNEEKFKKLLKL